MWSIDPSLYGMLKFINMQQMLAEIILFGHFSILGKHDVHIMQRKHPKLSIVHGKLQWSYVWHLLPWFLQRSHCLRLHSHHYCRVRHMSQPKRMPDMQTRLLSQPINKALLTVHYPQLMPNLLKLQKLYLLQPILQTLPWSLRRFPTLPTMLFTNLRLFRLLLSDNLHQLYRWIWTYICGKLSTLLYSPSTLPYLSWLNNLYLMWYHRLYVFYQFYMHDLCGYRFIVQCLWIEWDPTSLYLMCRWLQSWFRQ